MYTDFADVLGEESEVYDLIRTDAKLKDYRLKVEKFIREDEYHETIQRLKHNRPINAADIEALESILFSENGPGRKEDYLA